MFNAETVSAGERDVLSQIQTTSDYRRFSKILQSCIHGCAKTDGKQMSIRIQSPAPLCRGAYPGPPDFSENGLNRTVNLAPARGLIRGQGSTMAQHIYAYVSSETCVNRHAYRPGEFHPRTGEPIHKHGDFNRWPFGKRETLAMLKLQGAHNSYRRGAARLVAELLDWREILKTETNTPAMEKRVLKAARKALKRRNLTAFFEHGQWWIEHLPSGAQWSVCDASGPSCPNGFDFEQVSQGDEE